MGTGGLLRLDPAEASFLMTFAMGGVPHTGPQQCDPIDSSPPGSSVQEILQARILEWGKDIGTPAAGGQCEELRPGQRS